MMSRFLMIFMLGLALPFFACAEESRFQEGRHYVRFSQALPSTNGVIEVYEFFSYGCPHCRDFEPYLQNWKKKLPAGVELIQLPAIMNRSGSNQAKAFFAAQELGVFDTVHPAMFKALHDERIPVNTEEQIAELIKRIGLDEKQFLETMLSFQVDAKVRNAMQTIRQYRVRGVPAVAVNGRYMTSGGMAGTYVEMIKLLDYLVDKEIQANKT